MSPTIVGKCALCLQTKPLCDSHIIPEFCYKPTYDPIHRAKLLPSLDCRELLIQKGIHDHLLCENCERLINDHEKYFKALWFDSPTLPSTVTPPSPITVSTFDYAHFKLFHLSVLWRAGATSASFFSAVSLGPYAEKLRQQLLTSDPGSEDVYPIFGIVIAYPDKTICYELVGGPYKSRLDHYTVYYMCYAACEWTFIVTDHGFRKSEFKDLTLKKNSPLILGASEIKDLNSIKIFLEQRSHSGSIKP